jgi:hypothetical protein
MKLTGCWRPSAFSIGGGMEKSVLLSVKSETLNVADMMINFRGFNFLA